MDLAGDGIKQASKQFRTAAWVFEEAMKAATQLPVDCYSIDFSKEALNMNTNLCLAQAQYLFLKKATDAGMNAGILAKVASQVSEYFLKAFRNNQANNVLANFDNKRIANILGYHSHYFKALAYLHLGKSQYASASDEGRAMNKAVTYLTICTTKFTEARGYAQAAGGPYLANYNAKCAEAETLLAKAIKDNKEIFREPRVDPSDLPKLDAQNFVKLEPMSEELNKVPELDEQLRHIIPLPVRAMIDELKN